MYIYIYIYTTPNPRLRVHTMGAWRPRGGEQLLAAKGARL